MAIDDDRERARRAAREAICRLFAPLPHPYYEYMLREHGFSAAADAACQYVPEGKLERAVEAIPDEAVDRLTIAGTPDEARRRLADYEGIVNEVICVNVFYSASDQASMLAAYRRLIHL